MKIKILSFVFFFILISGVAQENLFLERSYWKKNPSIAAIEKAITDGNDVAELNRNMFDAVSYAILEQVDNTTLKHLISKKGNEVDKITHDGRTYIFWAAYKGNMELVEWLVAQGARADIEDAHGYTVLNFAANAGQTNTAMYDFLLANNAPLTGTTRSGANALLLVASSAKDEDILTYFIEKGLPFDSVDDNQNGIFQYAAKGGNLSLLKTLADKGADVKRINKNGENALFMAAQGTRSKQHGEALFAYLEELGLNPSITNNDGKNLLHLLANRNAEKAVFEHFLGKGLDPNAQDVEGNTPLMYAARGNSLQIVTLLTKATQDINLKDKKGRSALALAVSRNKPEVVKFLIENGADVTTKDGDGNTLAYYLLETFSVKNPTAFEAKWELLDKAGLKMNTLQAAGNSLLHLAAKENNLALLKRLKDFGIDVNQKNEEGNTPLHLAAMSTSNTAILKYLIAEGADLSLKTDFEESVYDLAKENELLQNIEDQLEFLNYK